MWKSGPTIRGRRNEAAGLPPECQPRRRQGGPAAQLAPRFGPKGQAAIVVLTVAVLVIVGLILDSWLWRPMQGMYHRPARTANELLYKQKQGF
jgi:hypothetical protein